MPLIRRLYLIGSMHGGLNSSVKGRSSKVKASSMTSFMNGPNGGFIKFVLACYKSALFLYFLNFFYFLSIIFLRLKNIPAVWTGGCCIRGCSVGHLLTGGTCRFFHDIYCSSFLSRRKLFQSKPQVAMRPIFYCFKFNKFIFFKRCHC